MRSSRFIELMKDPDLLDNKTLQELVELLEEFPYFQAARLLYLLNLKQVKDSRYYSQLRKTAGYMGDRKMLFYRLEKTFHPFLKPRGEKDTIKAVESSFELIDFFLSKDSVSLEEATPDTFSSSLLQTDYLSYSLREEAEGMNDEVSGVKPLKHQAAIDKFLQEDEKSPIKIELKTSEKEFADTFTDLDSVEEDSFFSETLAKIYLKQKKYEKALEIIRKLNLIYPEKNRYFADQIRFLEKLIINAKK